MLQYVDAFIKSRLQLVMFNYPTAVEGVYYRPIQVYEYMPDREKGRATYPAYVFSRTHIEHRRYDIRAGHELFVPDAGETTVEVPYLMGGGSATGVSSYTRKPYPTPINIYYEIYTLTTDKSQHDWITEMLFQTFPPGFQSNITGIDDAQYALFVFEKVMGMDSLEKPVFSSAYVLAVLDLWLDRVEHYTSTSITDADFDTEIVEE